MMGWSARIDSSFIIHRSSFGGTMCGIIGYVGTRDVVPVLIGGLKKLEYRGYDSAGIAVVDGNGVEVVRAEGKLSNLEAKLGDKPLKGSLDRKSTRLNSSHLVISYAVFCLKKKK